MNTGPNCSGADPGFWSRGQKAVSHQGLLRWLPSSDGILALCLLRWSIRIAFVQRGKSNGRWPKQSSKSWCEKAQKAVSHQIDARADAALIRARVCFHTSTFQVYTRYLV